MKPIKPPTFSLSSTSNLSSSASDPSSNILTLPDVEINITCNNNNLPPITLPSISALFQYSLPPLPTTRTRTNNPITHLPTRKPGSSAAVVSNTSTTTQGLVTTQRTKIIKTFVSPKGSTKIILMITITTVQEPLFNKEKNSWVMRRMTEIRKVMVRKGLRSGSSGKKDGVMKRTRSSKEKGTKEMKKRDIDSM
ncbi:hypothetical protein EAF04_009326 [Stromatinia cepivora]|nr:hypothetical protein EAF04_009326 [Stromatinia cepivora]